MKKLVEEKLKGKNSIEVKRLYLPFVYEKKCKCGNNIKLDLNDQYLSYPKINTPEQHVVYCVECDTQYEVDLQLEITVVVRDEDKILEN